MVPRVERSEEEALARADALINAMYATDAHASAGPITRARAVDAELREFNRFVAAVRRIEVPRGIEVVAHVMRHRPLARKLSGLGVAGLSPAHQTS